MGGKAKTLKNQKSQSRKGREKGTKREGKGREEGGSPRRKLDVQNWNSNSSHVTNFGIAFVTHHQTCVGLVGR
jgi:hypothetical protein